MSQFRDSTWDDSTFDDEVEDLISPQSEGFSKEVMDRWRGWDADKAKILEKKYQDLVASYEDKTPIQRSIYRNIAVAQMQADEAIANGNTNDFQKLMKVISDLMNDGKIKPLQDSGSEDGGLSTWGEWVRKIEEEEPIPEPSEEFKDVDGITKYIDENFVGHMKKVLGITNSKKSNKDSQEDDKK